MSEITSSTHRTGYYYIVHNSPMKEKCFINSYKIRGGHGTCTFATQCILHNTMYNTYYRSHKISTKHMHNRSHKIKNLQSIQVNCISVDTIKSIKSKQILIGLQLTKSTTLIGSNYKCIYNIGEDMQSKFKVHCTFMVRGTSN